jgi:hypothetical protein
MGNKVDIDKSIETRHNCERRDARNAAADGSEEAPKIGHRPTLPKQAKRTSDNLETGDRASKSRKKEASERPPKGDQQAETKLRILKKPSTHLQILPKYRRKSPDRVRLILIQRCDEKYHNKVVFLTRLFFAIASPQAFRQLSEACSIVRQNRESMISYSVNDDSGLMSALDLLDVGTTVRTILRRFYLVRLLDHRTRREDYYTGRRSSRIRAQRKQDYRSIERLTRDPGAQLEKDESRPGRADAKAFEDLLAMFYPNLKKPDKKNPSVHDKEYDDKHLKLKNRLNCARNWHLLQQKFPPGILALVPCGEFQIGTDK